MRRVWLFAQGVALLGLSVWVFSGAGCGAKSALRIDESDDEEEREEITPPPRECDSDVVCDDGEFCNGAESCVDGYCEEGEPVLCPEGDDCHMFYCDETSDRCVEVMIAEDGDGDGHFARPCGEDCDDSDPNVHPGAPELCNCVDDDCDGMVDEDLMQDCERDGEIGHRQCLDCEWTECLMCTVCIPGARRYCDTPTYCSWGEQICNSMGDGWGDCYETSAPSGCSGFSYDQDCCMRMGGCCQDWSDYDGDGDWNDTVGACEDVVCPGAP